MLVPTCFLIASSVGGRLIAGSVGARLITSSCPVEGRYVGIVGLGIRCRRVDWLGVCGSLRLRFRYGRRGWCRRRVSNRPFYDVGEKYEQSDERNEGVP